MEFVAELTFCALRWYKMRAWRGVVWRDVAYIKLTRVSSV